MAIEKLNFSGANSGYKDFESSGGSIADRLIKYGSYLGDREAEKAKQKSIDDQIIYSRGRDAKEDAYKDADIAEKAAEKNRLLQKEYNTTNALSAISDEKGYTAGKLASEQKSIEDTLASASPEDRIKIQEELKGYNPAASGQQWVGTALNQSNLDSGAIIDLKGNLRKEGEQTRQYNENKRIQQDQFNRTSAIQSEQNRISRENSALARQDRLDAIRERSKHVPKYEQYYSKDGTAITVDITDPASLDKASKSGFYNTDFIKAYGKSGDGSTSGSKDKKGDFFNQSNSDSPVSINYGNIKDDQKKSLEEKASATLRGSTGEKKEIVSFLDKIDSIAKAAKLSRGEAEELIDLSTSSVFGSEIKLNKDILDSRFGKEIYATPEGTITKSDALDNAFSRPETFKIISIKKGNNLPDEKVFLDLTLPKHKEIYNVYTKSSEPEVKAIKQSVVNNPIDKTIENNRFNDKQIPVVKEDRNKLSDFLLSNPAPTVENLKIIEDIASSGKNKELEERAKALSNSMRSGGVGQMSEKNKEEWKYLYGLVSDPASKVYKSYQENIGQPFSKFVNENAPGGNR